MKIKRESKDVVISLTEKEAYILAAMVEQSEGHNFLQDGIVLSEKVKESLTSSGIVLEYV